MSTAGMVRQSKERHPEQFCAVPRCLWRIKGHDGAPRTPCGKHHAAALVTDDRICACRRPTVWKDKCVECGKPWDSSAVSK